MTSVLLACSAPQGTAPPTTLPSSTGSRGADPSGTVAPGPAFPGATPTRDVRRPLPPASAATPAQVQASLDDLFDAARHGDPKAWAAGISRQDPDFAPRAAMLFANVSGLRLDRLRVRLTGTRQALPPARRRLLGTGATVWQATVDWRLPGERASAEQSVWLTVVPQDGSARLAGTGDGSGLDTPAQPLWWLGPVTRVRRDGVTLLLGQGQPAARWADLVVDAARDARRGLPAPLRPDHAAPVVVEVPGRAADFDAVLGAAPRTYAGTAAVTRPEGPTTRAATRVVVNPALADRPILDRRLTLTHETVHVLTRSASSPAPLWAVEGLAEQVAYRAQPEAAAQARRTLARTLATGGVPDRLPADAAFGAGAADATTAYALAWTACRVAAEQHSAADLGRFYARLDDGATVDGAAKSALGEDGRAFVRAWQAELRRLAAAPR